MDIVGYNVYEAPDGCCESFLGVVSNLSEAYDLVNSGKVGLEESLYETARTAGHCGGLYAPEKQHEENEPTEWFGPDGFHCAVAVFNGEIKHD